MRRGGELAVLALVFLVAFASCAQEEYPLSLWLAQHPSAEGGKLSLSDSGAEVQSGPLSCTQARAESLPARLVAMSASAPTTAAPILAEDIFQQHFLSVCGGTCHGPDADPPGSGAFRSRRLATSRRR